MNAVPVTSVRARAGGVILAGSLLLSTVAACSTNAGAAATVAGQRIAESDVSKWVPTSAAPASATSSTLTARQLVLNYLIADKLFAEVLQKKGQLPSATALAQSQAAAMSLLFNGQAPSGATANSLDPTLVQRGITPGFDTVIVHSAELESALIQQNKVNTLAQLSAVVSSVKVPVSVSPRYGSWDATNVTVSNSPTRDFLTTTPTVSVAPAQ